MARLTGYGQSARIEWDRPTVYICNECVELYNKTVETEIEARANEPKGTTNQSTTTQDHLGQREAWEALQGTAHVKL